MSEYSFVLLQYFIRPCIAAVMFGKPVLVRDSRITRVF
ncbi:Uncharacterized protein dnm_069850 [Desulfonema magnum]|uniref:Uncharacterized protein n=1 Tax=Desulfonema magnum TaxID=45655 RepID=A0A975BSQ6_9BACT|nr:Uncharacterized protein dnm_069850 [Desulfonema magnum]